MHFRVASKKKRPAWMDTQISTSTPVSTNFSDTRVSMNISRLRAPPGAKWLLTAGLVVCAATWAANNDEAAFLAENNAAMDRMMAGMEAKPSGDVDQDFVAMMVPHHQGAIEMAQAELRYGKNEQLRRIAQEIIVDQQQEIAAMRLALGQPLPPSAPAPTQPGAGTNPPSDAATAMPSMSMPMSRHHHE
jgi:hypothetical protein